MNRYPLNAADLAGNREVFGDNADADLALEASGQVIVGAVLGGSAEMAVNAGGEIIVGAVLGGTTSLLHLEAQGEIIRGIRGEAQSDIVFASALDLYRGLRGEGLSELEIQATGDGVIAPPSSATFTMSFFGSAEGTVASPVFLDPRAMQMQMDGGLEGRGVTPKGSPSLFGLRVNATGRGSLRQSGSAATATLSLMSEGEARLGRRIYLEAMRAVIALHGRGEALKWRRRYGEGKAVLQITMRENRLGKSTISAEFVAAPLERTFLVPEDSRTFIVPPPSERAS